MKRLSIAVIASVLIVGLALSAFAHSFTSTVLANYPSTNDQETLYFPGVHSITGCYNGGDATTCATGAEFGVYAGGQIYLVGDYRNFGTLSYASLRYPQYRNVQVTNIYTCTGSPTLIKVRTRARGDIIHNGVRSLSPWAYSQPMTTICP